MQAIARILGGLAFLILPTETFAQDWVPTKPVWDQAVHVTCKEALRYTCTLERGCSRSTGRDNFKIDFRRDKVTPGGPGGAWDIRGRAFQTYPLGSPTEPAMSILLSDGRAFRFLYKAKGPNGPFDLEARMLGQGDTSVEVFEFSCQRS